MHKADRYDRRFDDSTTARLNGGNMRVDRWPLPEVFRALDERPPGGARAQSLSWSPDPWRTSAPPAASCWALGADTGFRSRSPQPAARSTQYAVRSTQYILRTHTRQHVVHQPGSPGMRTYCPTQLARIAIPNFHGRRCQTQPGAASLAATGS
jgi:hypothetical protein